MPRADHVGKELQKKGHQQQPDVHPVDVGIGRDDDLVIAQVVHILLDVERRLQQVELFVLVDDLFRQPVTVQRLAPQRENGLRIRIPRFSDRSAGRVTLRDEDHRLFGASMLVSQMDTAIAQFFIVEAHLLGNFACLFLDA